jgi:hypothetical protein
MTSEKYKVDGRQKMKSIILRWLPCVAILGLMVIVVVPVVAKGPSGQAGKSNTAHLYLVTKDYMDPNWPVIPGPWGKMKYNLSGPDFDFVFNGHGLDPNTDYTLIYYPDKEGNPWPREDVVCLGAAMADEDGNVHIKDAVDTNDLPNPDTDINADPCLVEMTGAKIWLVLSEAVDCNDGILYGWSPGSFLFEYDLIWFDDTDNN